MKKIGLCTIAFSEQPLEKVLDLAKDVGFDAVEIWGKEPHISGFDEDAGGRRIRKLIDERDLQAAVFGSYLQLGVEGQISRAESVLNITRELGSPIVRAWAGNKASAEASRAERKRCLNELEAVCRIAERMGIIVAIEMHDGTLADTGESTRRLVEEVSVPNLKLNFQVSFPPDIDEPWKRLESVAPYVVNVHAQNFTLDKDGKTGRWERALIEEGVINYRKVLKQLRRSGFDGYFEVEFVKGNTFEEKVLFLKKEHEFLSSL